ncbi:hypothetical protein Tco_0213281 [Tanacetum coccineum]
MNAPGKSVDSFEEGEIIGESDDGCVKDCEILEDHFDGIVTEDSLHIKEGFDRWDLDFEAWKFCYLPRKITKGDLFASPPAAAAAVDFFAAPEKVVAPEMKPAESNIHLVDPFAAVPMNNFDTSDFFAGTEEKDKGLLNSLYKGRAMVHGS